MSLFQHSVLNKYIKEADQEEIKAAYQKLTAYFHNPTIQENIRESKEEQFQEGFLRELFVEVLGYTINPNPDYNLTTEFKNERGAKKADGAILKDGEAIGVIELKSTKTKDLEAIRLQAFDYKANQQKCVYVITSNFEKIRFYINNAVDFEEFDLFRLKYEDFQLMWLCLAKTNLLKGIPLEIKEASLLKEENVTKKIYVDYSVFKRELYNDLIHLNINNEIFTEKDEKEIKLILFQKSQKLLDRFLFIFFGEDRGLLPPNSISEILKQWDKLKELDEYKPLYERYRKYFNYLNKGWKGKKYEIFAYNGGLFAPDEILENISISDEILQKHTEILTSYDFESEVDVNILGHIFENSLNEIEEIAAQIEGAKVDPKKSKRKKDGVFYTPKYITKYIVENTVGKLCDEKKIELEIEESEYLKSRKGRTIKKLKELDEKLVLYREWLLTLTICDPACGSGAFLNQALDFLIREHRYIDELKAKLLDVPMVFTEVENSILENNIYGVDINEESVEIAKLSLWLRTAQKGRKLTTLSNNIKCGNSLIDSPKIAGKKAFNWQNEFPEVFKNGGFDVVIGNPPYITFALGSKQSHDEKIVEYLKSEYPLASVYKVSSYLIFIDKGIDLLNSKGKLSYIVPNTYHTNYYYTEFRNNLIDNFQIYELLDLRYKVFEDAEMGFTSIPFISKTKQQHETRLCRVNNFNDFNHLPYFKVNQLLFKNFPDTKFLFQRPLMNIWLKINRESTTLSEKKHFTFYNGTKTGNNSKFLADEKLSEICKPVLRGKDFYRYQIKTFEKYIIFDKEKLWSNVNDEHFLVPEKLLIRRTSDHLAVAFDNSKYYVLDTVHILYPNSDLFKASYLLTILNSKLFRLIYQLIVPEVGKAFAEVKIVNLKKLPIKNTKIDSQLSIGQKGVELQSMINNLNSIEKKFSDYFISKTSLQKYGSKLLNWFDLEFKSFISELNNAIKKAGGEKLSKIDEMEWMDVFEIKKAEVFALKSEIEKIDHEIDQMVYELYGLTDEEIKIVEGSV